MNTVPEHGLWCQDLCPCTSIENSTIAPPQGFHSRIQRQRRALALQQDEDKEEPTSVYEIAVKQEEIEEDLMNSEEGAAVKMRTKEPETYQRWRKLRDDMRALAKN